MRRRAISRTLIAFCLCLFIGAGFAQPQQAQETKPYEPEVGQPGKDVVWVPTPQTLVDSMLNLAKITPQDYLIDLGSGDGRTVITAAERGTRALGIEYNPDMVELSKANAAKAGMSAKASFMKADLFETDFSKATVITMFLLPDINMRLRPKLLELKPGTRIVSNSFTMEEWDPDETVTVEQDCTAWCTAYLWIVPAKVAGKWRLGNGELTLAQTFQLLSGTFAADGKTSGVAAKLVGDQITIGVGETVYSGRVNGNTMKGTNWTATRISE